jgi:hypothetical protein
MAYQFVKASNQFLSINDTAILDVTGAITLACHAKRNADLSTAQSLISKYESPSNRSYILQINTSGGLSSRFARDGTTNFISGANSTSTIPTNWSHLATTWTPNVVGAIMYLNGIAGGTPSSSNSNSVIYSGSANLTIGSGYGGEIAEVGIWSAALSAAEIASLAKGMTCDKIRPQSLVFYAPLVRNLQDAKGGLTITNNNGATVATHPRVYA